MCSRPIAFEGEFFSVRPGRIRGRALPGWLGDFVPSFPVRCSRAGAGFPRSCRARNCVHHVSVQTNHDFFERIVFDVQVVIRERVYCLRIVALHQGGRRSLAKVEWTSCPLRRERNWIYGSGLLHHLDIWPGSAPMSLLRGGREFRLHRARPPSETRTNLRPGLAMEHAIEACQRPECRQSKGGWSLWDS